MILLFSCSTSAQHESSNGNEVSLPPIKAKSKGSITSAIYHRKATRTFKKESLTIEEISLCLWAGGGKTIDGVTGATRSYAAAGGIYPLEFYLIPENVKGLTKGIYKYQWKTHSLLKIKEGSFINHVADATYSMSFRSGSKPACIVITAIPSRTASKYGKRGETHYVPMAVGGAGQTISLQAQEIGLGTYIIGAFEDRKIAEILVCRKNEFPMYVMPLGKL